MKFTPIAIVAAFALVPTIAFASSSNVRGQIVVYPVAFNGGESTFFKNRLHLPEVTAMASSSQAHAGMLLANLRDVRKGPTTDNLLPFPSGKIQINTTRLSPGAKLKLLLLLKDGSIVTQSLGSSAIAPTSSVGSNSANNSVASQSISITPASFVSVITGTEIQAAVASLEGIGSSISSANIAAAPTIGIAPAGPDEVSRAIAEFFNARAQDLLEEIERRAP